MAIFVIGYKEMGNGERLVRLYNSERKQTRDMKEKDLLFLKNDLKIMNADVEGKKLKGTTGSLEKVLNQNFFVIVSAKANKDGILGYNIVNIDGKELYVELKDMPFFFKSHFTVKIFFYSTVSNQTSIFHSLLPELHFFQFVFTTIPRFFI